jgi:multidrug efflux pump subunit AcrB
LGAIPIRAGGQTRSTRLDTVAKIRHISSPTEVDHYQIRRVVHIYVSAATEDLGQIVKGINGILAATSVPTGAQVKLRGMVENMQASFHTFAMGLILSVILVYLILVAQFASFRDPLLILLAIPPGVGGVFVILWITGTTMNVMSLMGIVMMVGIVVSDSILIVEFTRRLRADGKTVRQAVSLAAQVRLRPVLMTSLATMIGLLPMAIKMGAGSEAYAPLALAIIGGQGMSLVLTIFIVPAAYLLTHRKSDAVLAAVHLPALSQS